MNTLSIGAVCAFTTMLAGTAVAQERLPLQRLPQDLGPIAQDRLPSGVTTRDLSPLRPQRCQVDPAVASVTLTKGRQPTAVSVSYEIVNRGRSAWASGPRQQVVQLAITNSSSGRARRFSRTLTDSAGAGATMLTYNSITVANAFDTEFAGTVEVAIVYDPDIAIDGNPCNDDSNSGNNQLRIDSAEILAFMQSTATSRTFR